MRDGLLDFVDTVRATQVYHRESASISLETQKAWRRAWVALGVVIVLAFACAGKADGPKSFVVAKDLIFRSLGAISCVAFAVALRQNEALLGREGLSPAWKVADVVAKRTSNFERYSILPTIAWRSFNGTRIDAVRFDGLMRSAAQLGFASGLGLVVVGSSFFSGLLCFGIYVAQLSISSVGHPFYGYGWESLLAELAFLCGLWSFELIPGVAAMRWLCFKIMFGAGLIKMRAARGRRDCWKDLTAMTLFFETQPMPGPLSRRLHSLPRPLHLFATASNHVIELAAPLLLLIPFGTAAARAYGVVHLLFQVSLLFAGNLSFLNYLTMIPAIACFDDKVFNLTPRPSRNFIQLFGLLALAWLNLPVYQNLFAPSSTRLERPPRQAMNAAFDRILNIGKTTINLRHLRLANTYGAFGSVTNARDELIISGSRGQPDNWDFREFEFHGPTCAQVAPWHLRLDWQKWIFSIPGRDPTMEPYFLAMLLKLIQQDPKITRLLYKNPFTPENPPTHLRIQLFRYHFAPYEKKTVAARKKKDDETKEVPTPTVNDGIWQRTLRTTVLRPIGQDDLQIALLRLTKSPYFLS